MLTLWTQLFLRLWGKTLRGWLPTFFMAVLAVVLGLLGLIHWGLPLEYGTAEASFLTRLAIRTAQWSLFSGAVYIGVTLWLHVFDYLLKRK